MSGATPTLAIQAACIRHVTESAPSDEIAAGLRAAVRTIEWVEAHATTIKEVYRLMRESPHVLQLLTTFPGCALSVRDATPDWKSNWYEGAGDGV